MMFRIRNPAWCPLAVELSPSRMPSAVVSFTATFSTSSPRNHCNSSPCVALVLARIVKSLKTHPCACAALLRKITSPFRLEVTFSVVALTVLSAALLAPPDPIRSTHVPLDGSDSVDVTANVPGPRRTVWLRPVEFAAFTAAVHAALSVGYVLPSTVNSPLRDAAASVPVTATFAVELLCPVTVKAFTHCDPFQISYSYPPFALFGEPRKQTRFSDWLLPAGGVSNQQKLLANFVPTIQPPFCVPWLLCCSFLRNSPATGSHAIPAPGTFT